MWEFLLSEMPMDGYYSKLEGWLPQPTHSELHFQAIAARRPLLSPT